MDKDTESIQELVAISRFYGADPDYVIAGGGNTSFKNDTRLWIKASGIALATIAEDGFVCMSRTLLNRIGEKQYSRDPVKREAEVKQALSMAVITPKELRPSVETSLHNILDFAYVVHTHPTLVNGMLCSLKAAETVSELFGEDALYVEYTDPGYTLFRKVSEQVQRYTEMHGKPPGMIFLQNHGLFVGGNSIEEVKKTYRTIRDAIRGGLSAPEPPGDFQEVHSEALDAVRDFFSGKNLVAREYGGALISRFTMDRSSYDKVKRPFTPDIIVYCKSDYLFIAKGTDPHTISRHIERFRSDHGYFPRIILREGGGMICCDANGKAVETVRDVFLDMMKISLLSENFGGPHFMTEDQIAFIDNWEVENYRRKIANQ
ncbi:MAG: class II aldolase [Bacteroidales bacterium]|nr:class II aldolase [Bacteroidales bacterium]MBN2697245.1 class II aldolase [Bacteroidales bacterium]